MKLVKIKGLKENQIYKCTYYLNGDESDNEFYGYCTIILGELSNGDCLTEGFVIDKVFDKEFNLEKRDIDDDRGIDYYGKSLGVLDISHIVQDNKLVEIPRKEFEVETNDIIIQSIHIDVGCSTDSGIGCQMNDYREIIAVDKYEYLDFNGKYIPELSGVDVLNKNYKGDGVFTKIGIYGVTHEFVNDKLIKE